MGLHPWFLAAGVDLSTRLPEEAGPIPGDQRFARNFEQLPEITARKVAGVIVRLNTSRIFERIAMREVLQSLLVVSFDLTNAVSHAE
jgi:hypothetical protein